MADVSRSVRAQSNLVERFRPQSGAEARLRNPYEAVRKTGVQGRRADTPEMCIDFGGVLPQSVCSGAVSENGSVKRNSENVTILREMSDQTRVLRLR